MAGGREDGEVYVAGVEEGEEGKEISAWGPELGGVDGEGQEQCRAWESIGCRSASVSTTIQFTLDLRPSTPTCAARDPYPAGPQLHLREEWRSVEQDR